MSLFHICRKDCVIIMLITVKTLFYSANAYDNGFLNVFSTGNLLNSHTLWQYRVCAKEWKRTVYMSTQTFSAQFTAKDISCIFRVYLVKNISKWMSNEWEWPYQFWYWCLLTSITINLYRCRGLQPTRGRHDSLQTQQPRLVSLMAPL